MSKSSGDVLTADVLEQQGYDPLAYRYLVLTAHYRNPLKFDDAGMQAAQRSYDRLKDKALAVKNEQPAALPQAYWDKMLDALCDDLNTAQAIVHLREALEDTALSNGEKHTLLDKADTVLALALLKDRAVQDIPQQIIDMAQARQDARKAKDFAEADRLRDAISAEGFTVEDTPDGPKVKKA